jgi:nicotinate phosphoribosyltransferase
VNAQPSGDDRALFTDLYELTMGAAYHAGGLDTPATFELFVRGLPAGRNFLVAAGLEQVLDYLESLQFKPHHLVYLHSLGTFSDEFLDHLSRLRFTGDAWAIPEGTVFFPDEPLLRITAPRIQAQLVETFVLTAINFQSMVASKAARIGIAAAGCPFVDFSPRRDHGRDAALYAARAAYIAGAAGTSNVEAGMRFGLPTSGTMAHSFVMSFAEEVEAFCAYLRTFPDGPTLLIDTYDTIQGARNAVEAHRRMQPHGAHVGAVRLDSGSVSEEARAVREILNAAGLRDVRIFASGDLDEYAIAELLVAGAPVDAFGVGTRLGVSADAPYLSGVYKLVDDVLGPRLKTSTGKETLPGAKQVWRHYLKGVMAGDVIGLADEPGPGGEPLLTHVLKDGQRTTPPNSLDAIRARCAEQLAALPDRLRSLEPEEPYPVGLSQAMQDTRMRLRADYSERAG